MMNRAERIKQLAKEYGDGCGVSGIPEGLIDSYDLEIIQAWESDKLCRVYDYEGKVCIEGKNKAFFSGRLAYAVSEET